MAEGESATYVDIIEEINIQLFLPPNLPPNDRLRQLNLYKGLYHISMNISEFD